MQELSTKKKPKNSLPIVLRALIWDEAKPKPQAPPRREHDGEEGKPEGGSRTWWWRREHDKHTQRQRESAMRRDLNRESVTCREMAERGKANGGGEKHGESEREGKKKKKEEEEKKKTVKKG